MLDHTLAPTKPRNWATTEPPASAAGVTEAWIEFETEAGRGRGHLRLKDGKAWTLLTTLAELTGTRRARDPGAAGRRARRQPGARDVAAQARRERDAALAARRTSSSTRRATGR